MQGEEPESADSGVNRAEETTDFTDFTDFLVCISYPIQPGIGAWLGWLRLSESGYAQ